LNEQTPSTPQHAMHPNDLVRPMQERDDDEINLRELFDLLWSGKILIAAVTLFVFVLGIAYALIATPVYQADGVIQVEQEKNSMSAALSDLTSLIGAAPAETQAEIAIIKSRLVLGEVAKNLRLAIVAEPNYFPVIGRAIARRRADLDQPAQAWLGLDRFAWGGERIVVTTFNVPDALLDSPFKLVATASGFDLLDQDGQKVLAGEVGEQASAATPYGLVSLFVQDLSARTGTEMMLTRVSPQKLFATLQEALQVSEQGKDSGIVNVVYESTDPVLVARTINEIQTVYLRQNVERKSEEAEQSIQFLNKQLPDVKAKVEEAQAKLNAFQLSRGSADVQMETELVLQQAVALDTQQLSLQQQRELALQRFTPSHPTVLALDEQIRSVADASNKLKSQVEKLPETQQEIFSLHRDLEVNTGLYTAMLNSLQELQVTKAGTVGNVRIIDSALQPREATKPKKALILAISLILGGGLGAGLLMFRRMMLRGVDRPEDVERALGLPTYASIPYSRRQQSLIAEVRRGSLQNGILASLDGADLAVEAFRSLRTSLSFALLESPNNIVMLTGPLPALGKSFVAINLGAVLALAGKRVVVVDADLRRGRLHSYTGHGSGPGVSDYVVKPDLTLDEVARETPVSGLYLVSRGATPPNPAEVLLHDRFAEMMRELSARFDHVIVDTAPVLPVADASIVGQLAGCTLIVLKAAEHPIRTIEETVRRLRQSGVAVKGVLFNQVGAKLGSYGYGYYGYAYGYGYSSYGYKSEKS